MQRNSLATLVNSKVIVPSQTTEYTAVEKHFLASAMAAYIGEIYIDEAWYVAKHPDVAKAMAKGLVEGASDHYRRFGWWENRQPYPIDVDDRWYRDAYPDVEHAIARRAFRSAQEHFEEQGFREGRFPHPDFNLRTTDEPSTS